MSRRRTLYVALPIFGLLLLLLPFLPRRPVADNRDQENTAVAADVRRLPIAGQPDQYILIFSDGTTWLERADKTRVKLLDAVSPALPANVTTSPKVIPRPAGQLIVLDAGVVEIPLNAIVTYVGESKVITHEVDGRSTVYHVDGRIEYRHTSGKVRTEK